MEIETRTRVTEALEKLGVAQDTLFELREALFRLQGENAHLREELAARKEWDDQAAKYTLTKTSGGSMVYASPGPPPHFACAVCFPKKTIHILQDVHDELGTHHCPSCQNYFRGVSEGSRPTRARRSVREDDAW